MKIRGSLNIGHFPPFTRSLVITERSLILMGSKVLLGSHLQSLSNRYHGQVWLQRCMSLDAFKSGARYKGLKFSKRQLNKELGSIVEDAVPTGEERSQA